MPGPSIESVNSTSASDWSQEGDFVNEIKITAFLFLTSSSMVDNALLIAVFNMACADVLPTLYAVPVSIVNRGTAYSHQWLITGVAGQLLCRLSQFIGQMSVLVCTAWKFACDCL